MGPVVNHVQLPTGGSFHELSQHLTIEERRKEDGSASHENWQLPSTGGSILVQLNESASGMALVDPNTIIDVEG